MTTLCRFVVLTMHKLKLGLGYLKELYVQGELINMTRAWDKEKF